MHLKILSIQRIPHHALEKVVLEVLEDDDLIGYCLALGEKKCYAFPNLPVKRNDRVHVISGHGKDLIIANEEGHRTFVFFCNRNECLWSEGNPSIVVNNPYSGLYRSVSLRF